MTRIKLNYVHEYIDRHGKLRRYFRRTGFGQKPLTGTPGSAEFAEAYQLFLEQTGGVAPREVGAARTKEGTIDALIVAYYKNDAFTEALAPETQRMRRNILERFREEHGDKRAVLMQQRHVVKILNGKERHAKKNWLKTIKGLMDFAVGQELRADNPCNGVKLAKLPKSTGHMTWLEPQVEQYRQHHQLGTTARLALELLLNIAARRYDAHVVGPQHVIISNRDGVKKLCWRPHKTLRSTAKMLKIRMLPSLHAALDAMPKPDRGTEVPLAFLTNDYGKPFASAAAFGNKFAEWCKQAGLEPVICEDGRIRSYRAHGLRKAALRAAAHAGCTLHELMALSGHSSAKQLQEYLEEIEQEFMADSAIDKLLAYETKAATFAG